MTKGRGMRSGDLPVQRGCGWDPEWSGLEGCRGRGSRVFIVDGSLVSVPLLESITVSGIAVTINVAVTVSLKVSGLFVIGWTTVRLGVIDGWLVNWGWRRSVRSIGRFVVWDDVVRWWWQHLVVVVVVKVVVVVVSRAEPVDVDR